MKTERGVLRGPQTLARDLRLRGSADSDITIPQDVAFDLQGRVDGNVTILAGGCAMIRGVVRGTVINDGGTVAILGMVGWVTTRKGSTTIAESAVIGKLGAS